MHWRVKDAYSGRIKEASLWQDPSFIVTLRGAPGERVNIISCNLLPGLPAVVCLD